jgi:ABC-type polysaccharide/polyol phosphate export permease
MSVDVPVSGSYVRRSDTLESSAGGGMRPDYPGLIWTLVRTAVKVHYHGSLTGFAWALLRPLSMFLALVGMFSLIFAAEPNFMLNLLVGLFLYEFFGGATKAGLVSLYAKGYLLTKVRFPVWIVVAVSSVNAMIVLLVFMATVLIYLAASGSFPSPLRFGLFLFYVVQLWGIILGFSLAVSPLYLRYRDLNHIWDAVVQAGFFVAPILFTVQQLPAHIQPYLFLWPPTPVIVYSREVLIRGGIPSVGANLYLLAMTLLILGMGVLVFRRFSRGAAEQL